MQQITGEVAIWERIIEPHDAQLTVDAAKYFLNLSFGSVDLARMHELAEKQQLNQLSSAEQDELSSYRKVGLQLDLLRSKARRVVGIQPAAPDRHS